MKDYYMFLYFFQRETDGVKIKTKMLEDQTETIRKLKEVSLYNAPGVIKVPV